MEDNRISNFEGETAANFLDDMSINGFGMISMAINRMFDEDDRPGLMECEEALVACEIVAATLGQPAEDLPEDLNEWIGMFLPYGSEPHGLICGLAEKAAESIDKIVSDSELRELWEESPVFEAWVDAQIKLQERILERDQ